jgi:transposase
MSPRTHGPHVVQPSSVPVDRRLRRAKSDGIDAELLLRTLLAWLRGEPHVCSMVPIPDEADEDVRRCVRERTELLSDRVGLTNRIGAVLATLGVNDYNPLLQSRRRRLAELRTGLGEPIPPNALAKIERLLARLELVLAQIAELERERDEVAAADAPDRAGKMIQQLASLRGIGVQSATVLVREAFVRYFPNGKALGSYAGLTSTPYSSVSGVSTIETDLRFSGREDFWIIVAARSEDETEIRAGKQRKTRSGTFGARHVDTFQLKRRSASY